MRWPVRVGVAVGAVVLAAAPAAAETHEETMLLQDVPTVIAVVDSTTTPDFPVASLMRADCEFVLRLEAEDGSAQEFMSCQLSDEPVIIPENQGSPPTTTILDRGGECLAMSDYWFSTDGSTVYASEYEAVVTPSGRVAVWSMYPAEALECPDAREVPQASPDAGAAEASPMVEASPPAE